MAGKIHDQRHFIMFEREDQGFEYGQSPSGYLKIEVRGGKGKLSALAQNLKYSDNLSYRLYLIKCSDYELIPIDTGTLVKKNSFEADWGFDPERVGGSGNSIDEFNIAAIIAEYSDRKKVHIECPLAAYRGKKISWRRKLEEFLSEPPLKQQPAAEDLIDSIETMQETDEAVQTDGVMVESMETVNNNTMDFYPGTEQIAEERNENLSEADCNSEIGIDAMPDQNPEDSAIITDEEYDSEFGKGCIYKENNTCGFKEGTLGFYNPCVYCNIGNNAKNQQYTNRAFGSSDSLRKSLDKYFETFDPFESKRKDYKWWKVNNPVYLNNVLYQYNIRTPLLFNPKVMMAHFKYKHLIVGIYTDRMRHREFIVCGVPGVYSVDEKPFGDMCRWVQLEGNRPKHGAFGYWLVYMDSRTGKFINLG